MILYLIYGECYYYLNLIFRIDIYQAFLLLVSMPPQELLTPLVMVILLVPFSFSICFILTLRNPPTHTHTPFSLVLFYLLFHLLLNSFIQGESIFRKQEFGLLPEQGLMSAIIPGYHVPMGGKKFASFPVYDLFNFFFVSYFFYFDI